MVFNAESAEETQSTQRLFGVKCGLVLTQRKQRGRDAEAAGLGASRDLGNPAGRGAVCDGLGRDPAGGPVNKFPAANGALPQPLAGLSSPRRIGMPAFGGIGNFWKSPMVV